MEADISACNAILNGNPQESMECNISAFNAILNGFPLNLILFNEI